MGLIETYKEQIRKLCEMNKVKSLYAFGSVNTALFNHNSDVDLLVDFEINDPVEYSEKYFNLKFNLEKLLNRSIDLLENKSIRNPFLRQSIDKSKALVYGG